MKKILLWTSLFSAKLCFSASVIDKIDFTMNQGQSEVTLSGVDSSQVQMNSQNDLNQVVLEIKQATLSNRVIRALNTSAFDSVVKLISPYQLREGGDQVKIVIQLRENATPEVKAGVKTYTLVFPKTSTYTESLDGVQDGAQFTQISDSESSDPTRLGQLDGSPLDGKVGPSESGKAFTQKDRDILTLEQFLAARNTKNYVGKKINLQLREADLVDVFQLISDTSGFNIVLGDNVTGKITLSLTEVPWDQALDLILQTKGLGAERNQNVLRILTLQNLTKEKEEELRARQAVEVAAPRVTRIFPISYANDQDLIKILQQMGSANSSSSSGGSTNKTVIEFDKRTSSLIVQDTAQNLERIQKLIELLDTPIPQVLIEAKIVEASDNFSKSVGSQLSILSTNTAIGFAGADPFADVASLFSSSSTDTTSSSSSSSSSSGGNNSQSLLYNSGSLGFISKNLNLNTLISLAESEQAVKVLSSPKTVVLNKQKAEIISGEPVFQPSVTIAGGSESTSSQIDQAKVGLAVEPSVTNDGSVILDLTVNKDVIFPNVGLGSAKGERKIQTRVLVDDGATLVIGGLYSSTEREGSAGVPFLKDIPVLGFLFGTKTKSSERTELMIFISPKILNSRSGNSRG